MIPCPTSPESGGGSLKTLVIFAIIGIAAFYIIRSVGANADAKAFKVALQSIIDKNFMGDDQALIDQLLNEAAQRGYPMEKEDIQVSHPTPDSVKVDLDYTVPVDLVVTTVDKEYSETLSRARSSAKKIVDQISNEVKQTINNRMEGIEADLTKSIQNRMGQ